MHFRLASYALKFTSSCSSSSSSRGLQKWFSSSERNRPSKLANASNNAEMSRRADWWSTIMQLVRSGDRPPHLTQANTPAVSSEVEGHHELRPQTEQDEVDVRLDVEGSADAGTHSNSPERTQGEIASTDYPPGPSNPVAAVASHTNPEGKDGRENKDHKELLADSKSEHGATSQVSGPPLQPTEPIKYRRQNVVLPSYEPELLPDNTVVPESAQKQVFHRLLHTVTNWIYRKPAEEPRRVSILERLVRSPHTVRRIAVVGVHGWFPGKFLQRVVGEPTGTSGRFAEKMATAVRMFFSERYNIMLGEDAITLMPLEGEGKVERRVEILYRQLVESQQWRKKLWEADMVFFSAHSQGTPVSVMLLSRLIREGLVDVSRQKVCLLAMAGITHGPYPSLKSSMIVKYFEADAARELFEFNDANSEIAKKYVIAMRHMLSCGVRVVAIGSWYDQVVPLYSAVMHGFHHPNIYRGLYIDGADYSPDFMSHLVVFGLKLRNNGLSDHNLVVHLSDILAGNLYGFGTQGHSAIYEELNTYTLAVAWTMGAKPAWSIPPRPSAPWTSNAMVSQSLSAPSRLNPYYLPWIMARLIDDPAIRGHPTLRKDLDDLLKMYEIWEPSTKQLKEMRYRLEPLRSRL